jgi:hypothetical protein
MATTPNFNWSTPDNTGLVKNGALDIRTLGNAIDASMVDLKGGTTGQVLAKATNTDMDFTWSTPSATAFVGCSLENASTSIANNTDTYLTFSGELYDTDAMHSTSTNTSRITIPSGKGGYYEFRWSMVWDNNTTNNRRIRLVKNGASYEFGPILTIRGVGLTGLTNSTVVSTVAGDYWELQAFQDSGGALSVGVGGSLMFQANKVG